MKKPDAWVVDAALLQFREDPTGPRAMVALRVFSDAELPIPKDLKPWLRKACSAWEEKKGNKVRVGSMRADHKYDVAVDMALHQRMAGATVDESIEAASKATGIPYSTIRREYYSPRGKQRKQLIDIFSDILSK